MDDSNTSPTTLATILGDSEQVKAFIKHGPFVACNLEVFGEETIVLIPRKLLKAAESRDAKMMLNFVMKGQQSE